MKKRVGQAVAVVALVTSGLVAMQGVAQAGAPPVLDGSDGGAFLCPDVGNETAAAHNGKGWGSLPEGDFTFLPGHNQAGASANPNANNTLGPGESPGPGAGNSDWSPIWPGAAQ